MFPQQHLSLLWGLIQCASLQNRTFDGHSFRYVPYFEDILLLPLSSRVRKIICALFCSREKCINDTSYFEYYWMQHEKVICFDPHYAWYYLYRFKGIVIYQSLKWSLSLKWLVTLTSTLTFHNPVFYTLCN